MIPGARVSFLLAGKTALGTIVSAELSGSVQVAVDPQFMQGSQGVLKIVIFIPLTSLKLVP